MMALPGNFAVNSTGAATYTIPIMVPPGTAGMVPDLSLDYSNNYLDGPEGLGWVLGGIPAIVRCPQTIAQNGVHGGVTFGLNPNVGDRFCLNGRQLIAVNGGAYGADQTEYRLEVDDFTKIISYGQSGSGPTYFIAWTKSGRKMQFGNLANNQFGTAASAPLVAVSTTGSAGTIRSWGLDTLWDTKGNYLRVIYDYGTPDIHNGQLYPTQINYTANDGAGLSAYNSVTFTYMNRADVVPTYEAGSLLQFTVLLTHIKTYVGSVLVHDYQLGYQTADVAATNAGLPSSSANAFHDELRTIRQCDPIGTCQPTTTIGWEGGIGLPPINPPNNTYVGVGFQASGIYSGDLNGDGITDLLTMMCPAVPGGQYPGPSVWLGTGGGNFSPSGMVANFGGYTNQSCFVDGLGQLGTVTDIDGDGFADVVQQVPYWAVNEYGTEYWNLNNQQGSLNQVASYAAYMFPSANQSGYGAPIWGTYGDFNGDGRLDYFMFTGITGGGCCINGLIQPVIGTGQIFTGNLSGGAWSFSNGPSFTFNSPNKIFYTPILTGDFDGDGCADLLFQGPGSEISFSGNMSNPALPSVSIPNWEPSVGYNSADQFIIGDFNGDGKSDVLEVQDYWYATSQGSHTIDVRSCNETKLYLSTGTALMDSGFSLPSNDWCLYSIVTGDFNGDGKTDIALVPPGFSGMYGNTTPISIWLSTGNGFVQAGQNGTISNQDQCSFPYVDVPGVCMGAAVADWNSDGAADLWLEPGSWQGSSPTISPLYTFAYKPEYVTSITTGLNSVTTIQYGQLNNPAVYTKGSGATYPTQDVADTQYVVSKVTTSNAQGGTFIKNYTYAGAKKDLGGRGFLGFTSVTMTEPQNDTSTTTVYATAFPFTGMVLSQSVTCTAPSCPTSVTLKSTSYCYTTSQPPPQNCPTPTYYTLGSGSASRYFVPLRQTIDQTTDQNGTKMPTVTTTNTYDCDAPGLNFNQTNPCFGDVTQVVSQSTDPNNNNQVLWTKTTTNTYTDDANLNNDGDWLLGRLLTSNIESVFGGSDTTRHTSFCYDLPYATSSCSPAGASGLLLIETLEPNASDVTLKLVSTYQYDVYGNKSSVTVSGCLVPGANNASCLTPATRTTTTKYDTVHDQFAWKVINNLGESETWGTATSPGYDPRFGSPTTHTGPNGSVTSWTYDTFGRMTNETRPDGAYSSYSYNYCSGVNGGTDTTCPVNGLNNTNGIFSVTDTEFGNTGVQDGPTKVVYYDMLSRVIASNVQGFNGCWLRQDTIYTNLGRVWQTNRPYFLGTPSGNNCQTQTPAWTINSYDIPGGGHDVFGRVQKQTRPDGGKTTYAYAGLVTTVTEYLSGGVTETTTTLKNAQGLTASVTDALAQSQFDPSHTTNYTYDGFGDLLTTIDPNANLLANNTYDLRGRKRVAVDADMGTWTYNYDSFGEIYTQTDAKGQLVTMYYDGIGRLTQRVEPDMTSAWQYGTAAPSIDKLVQETCSGTACAPGGYTRNYVYDSLSRQIELDDYFGSTKYSAYTQYDTLTGKVSTATAFGGFKTNNIYNQYGYLYQITDYTSGFVYWQVLGRDAEMHATQQQLNGTTAGKYIQETQGYDPNSGRVVNICATIDTGSCDGDVANFSYGWDTNGNLLNRSDLLNTPNLYEAFCYDLLNRLTNYAQGASNTTCTQHGAVTNSVGYDAIGNITSKSDVATSYVYGGARPHAVTSIVSCTSNCMNDVLTNGNYYYDANGNLLCITASTTGCDSSAARTYGYSSFNMTESIATGSTGAVALSYDPDHARAQMCVPGCNQSLPPTKTFYMNDPVSGTMSELVTHSATPTWRTYIMADGKLVAERFVMGSNVTMNYFITDHLGSVAVVTDQNGQVLASEGRLYYDPWGKMKNANGSNDTACAVPPASVTTRGFTGQEQMPNVCLDNYNARVYDPTLGKFLTPDSVVSDEYTPQTLNRFTYVDNMPLSLTDPTGHDGDGPGFLVEGSSADTRGSPEGESDTDTATSSGDNENDQTSHYMSDSSGSSASGTNSKTIRDWPNGSKIVVGPDGKTHFVYPGDAGAPNLQNTIAQDNASGGNGHIFSGPSGLQYVYLTGSSAGIPAAGLGAGQGGFSSAVVQSGAISNRSSGWRLVLAAMASSKEEPSGHAFVGGLTPGGDVDWAEGWYPSDQSSLENAISGPGAMHDDRPLLSDALAGMPGFSYAEFDVDRGTYLRTEKFMANYGVSGNSFSLVGDNCTTAALRAMDYAGVAARSGPLNFLEHSLLPTPNALYAYLNFEKYTQGNSR